MGIKGPFVTRRWTLSEKLAILFSGASLALVLASSGFLYWSLVQTVKMEDDLVLHDKLLTVQSLIDVHQGDFKKIEDLMERSWNGGGGRQFKVYVSDQNGNRLIQVPTDADGDLGSLFSQFDRQGASGTTIVTSRGRKFRGVVGAFFPAHDSGHTHFIKVALDLEAEEKFLALYRRHIGVVLFMVLLACAWLGRKIAVVGLKPLEHMTNTARKIRFDNLHERMDPADYPADFHQLVATFNGMLDRLSRSFSKMSQFSADIAHELRTPLNNLRGEIEVALGKPRSLDDYQEILISNLEECERISRILEGLMLLAQSENNEERLILETLELAHEIRVIHNYYEDSAADAGIKITMAIRNDPKIYFGRIRFQRVISNLVANAVKFSKQGGLIVIEAWQEAGQVKISVSDNGIGIPAQSLPFIFDRFYRVDSARASVVGGAGLGLSIVKSLVHLYGGTISVVSELDKGTIVTIVLPSAT